MGTVILTSAAASGGMTVALSSDNTAAASVPASVTVATGSTNMTFPVTTFPQANSQSALIIASAGAVTAYAIRTVRTQSSFSNGIVAIIPGGNGGGTITSQPAGNDCTVAAAGGGACSSSYPVATVVRLLAKAAAGCSFQGWRGLPGCGDPSKITVARGTTIYCQPGFAQVAVAEEMRHRARCPVHLSLRISTGGWPTSSYALPVSGCASSWVQLCSSYVELQHNVAHRTWEI